MDKNIFETVGKQGKGGKDKSSKSKPESNTAKKKDQDAIDPEINKMLDRMKFMKEDLDNQLTSVYQKGKDANVNVSQMIEKANVLSPKQLEKIREQERVLNEKINIAIPAESCLKKAPKSKEKLTQERQGKLRGARNKWIPVR